MRCNYFFIVEIIVESVNLIQMSEQYLEQLGFYKKVHIKTHRLSIKKNVLIILCCKKRKIPNFLTQTVLKTTSNAIFNMKKIDLDES